MKLLIKESYSALADKIVELVNRYGFWTREDEFINDIESIGADVQDCNYEYADIMSDDEECVVYFNRGGNSFTISKIKCYNEDGNSFWYEEDDLEECFIKETFSEDDDLEDLIQEGFSVDDDLQDIWDFVQEQQYDSAATSLNQLAGGVKAVAEILPAGSLNLDYGGGRYNQAVEYLKQVDVMNLVFDPFNRSKEHNREVLDIIKEYGGADSCTCCNVFNVIDGDAAKITALKNIRRLVRSGGSVYIQTYEGSDKIETQNDKGKTVKKPSGVGKTTKKGWQENKETKAYIPLVQEVFPDAMYKVIKGVPMIVCTA